MPLLICLILNVVAASARPAQSPAADDAVLNRAVPDVVVINLPTGMPIPRLKGNFRLTHRFAGNLRRGGFGDQLGDLFGLDEGAIIGLEYRMAVVRSVQAVFYRSSFDKTIQFQGLYDGWRQRGAMPLSVSPVVSVEGTNNFRDKYAPGIGVVLSRAVGTHAAAYLTPAWVNNTAASLNEARSTTFIGIGGRVRVHGTTYVAAEIAPRVAGYAPDTAAYGFSIEKRAGGHMFSLTFTNSFGTTLAQVARGGAGGTLYLGFNLGRKFF